jgi:hypothetical protein
MKHWSTTIRAIDPITGDLKLWNGPSVLGISFDDAVMIYNNTQGDNKDLLTIVRYCNKININKVNNCC